MNGTYKFLQKLITRNFEDKTSAEICGQYQKTRDNEILAYEFCKNFSLWKRLIQKYGFFIEKEELPSLVLETLDKALSIFDTTGKTSLTTYIITCVKNKLIKANIHYELKNQIERECVSYNADTNADGEDSYLDLLEDITNEEEFDKLISEMDIDKNFDLNEFEKELCNLVVSGEAVFNLELAEAINKNRLTIYKKLKTLREKLSLESEYLRGM